MSLWTPLLWLAIISPLLLIAHLTTKKTDPKYLLIFGGYFLADSYIRILGYEFIKLDFIGIRGNWTGTLLCLVLALIFIFSHSKQIREDIGFTQKFNKKTLKLGIWIFLGFLLVDLAYKLIYFPSGKEFDFQLFMFQATMPGLSEEILFRGILLWILGRAFIPSKKVKGVYFGWGFVIVTFLFGMIHGVILTESMEFRMNIEVIIYLTMISSLSLGILRKFSGNLILPTLGHNIINLMNFFVRML